MKIYTKKGDKGLTSLIGGTKVSKKHLRIECYGTIDELNACLGVLCSMPKTDRVSKRVLEIIQDRLFVIGSLLASDPKASKMVLPKLKPEDIRLLESEMDRMSADLPELRAFILPGGVSAGAWCHVVRTVCRRAERLVVALDKKDKVDASVLIYLNRLSDYFFVLSRKINNDNRVKEIQWKPERLK